MFSLEMLNKFLVDMYICARDLSYPVGTALAIIV
jgi:hypothetical protein